MLATAVLKVCFSESTVLCLNLLVYLSKVPHVYYSMGFISSELGGHMFFGTENWQIFIIFHGPNLVHEHVQNLVKGIEPTFGTILLFLHHFLSQYNHCSLVPGANGYNISNFKITFISHGDQNHENMLIFLKDNVFNVYILNFSL